MVVLGFFVAPSAVLGFVVGFIVSLALLGILAALWDAKEKDPYDDDDDY
jgi:hypothetical protein